MAIETQKRRAKANEEVVEDPPTPPPKKQKTRRATPVVTNNVEEGNQRAEPQGTRKLPAPKDTYGCGHNGIMNLQAWTNYDLKFYTKTGYWLYNKPCSDCLQKPPSEANRVMNVRSLMLGKETDLGAKVMVCTCGPTAHGMKADNPSKPLYACDLVLCMPCYNERKCAYEITLGASSQRRSTRLKS